MKRIPFYKFLPGVAWFFVVLILMCIPGKELPGTSFFDKIYGDKIVHACIFGAMVILFIRPIVESSLPEKSKVQYFLGIAISVTLWGLATEFIQKYLVIGRNFDLLDFVADAIGCALAYWFSKKYLLNFTKT